MVPGTEIPIELDWRFAELVVRTWMEPELAVRYLADPVSVLAEFGLSVADAVLAPKLASYPEAELVIEYLDGSEADLGKVPACTICSNDPAGIAGNRAGAR